LINNDTYFDVKQYLINTNSDEFLVAIEPNFIVISNSFGLRKNKQEYQLLFDKLRLNEEVKPLEIKNITTKYDNVKIIKFTNLHKQKLKQRKEYRDFDLLMSFSRIVYNEKFDRALLTVSSSISSLAGSYDLCFLKKENGKWKIIDFQNISIS
jgi:hypothetical protein